MRAAATASLLLGFAVGLAFHWSGPGRLLELKTVDWRTRFHAQPESADPSIVVVDIDERSLRALEPIAGRWPWPREVHGLVVDALAGAGARLIIYDVLFVERDRSAASTDEKLVASVAKAGNVLLAAQAHKQPNDAPVDGLQAVDLAANDDRYPGLLVPFAELRQAARGLGLVNIATDEDGVLRRALLSAGYRDRRFATLPFAALRVIFGTTPEIRESRLRVDGLPPTPLDPDGRVLLRFRGPPDAYRHVSFAEVLRAQGQALKGEKPELDLGIFHDRLVIVSATATGLFDQHSGPFPGEYPGGELLATALDNLLRGDALKEVRAIPAVCLIALTAGATVVPLFLLRAVPGLFAGVAILLAIAATIFATFGTYGVVVPLLAPVVAGVAAVGSGAGIRYAIEGRERRRTRAVFSRYVSDQVVERLLDSPDALDLGGTETEISVLFSDIRNFTTHSERMAPRALVTQLNEYFAEMTETIFAEEGTINKFIGDAVMAIFGAPLPQADHAARAVRAALGMHAALERLNRAWAEQGRPEWQIGVGIATGSAIVGNVGSLRRTEFTVIGDTVNLASRLEGENKTLGTRILVSEATARAAGDGFRFEARGEIHVKGKERGVHVFAVPVNGGRGLRGGV